MKKGKLEIELKDKLRTNGVLHQLVMEVEDEKRQLNTTESVNKATSKLHYKILSEFVSALNKEIELIEKGFEPIESVKVKNGYEFFRTKISDLGWRNATYYLFIVGSSQNKINSMHQTYAGEYKLHFGEHENYNNNKVVNSMGEVIKIMEVDLKEELRKVL